MISFYTRYLNWKRDRICQRQKDKENVMMLKDKTLIILKNKIAQEYWYRIAAGKNRLRKESIERIKAFNWNSECLEEDDKFEYHNHISHTPALPPPYYHNK